ncbi:MAG: HVO_0476 family zinc finger protein [Halobacteriaceae archaeon]
MSESTERVAVPCPSCAPEVETVHEVLTEGGGYATLRCTQCHHVHKEQLPEAEEVERDVIVSQDGDSIATTVEAPRGETIARGEEFVLETEEAILEVRITDLQLGAEERTEEAPVEDVETIWTRAVGNVSVNVTVNPGEGGADSRGITVQVPGDYEFTVGEVEEIEDEEFEVKNIFVREDARGYGFDKLDHDGDAAFAKDVKRVYAVDESSQAWSAW